MICTWAPLRFLPRIISRSGLFELLVHQLGGSTLRISGALVCATVQTQTEMATMHIWARRVGCRNRIRCTRRFKQSLRLTGRHNQPLRSGRWACPRLAPQQSRLELYMTYPNEERGQAHQLTGTTTNLSGQEGGLAPADIPNSLG